MRKWLSSLLYFVIALILVALLLPFILGLVTENRCKKIVEIINTTTPFNAKIIGYKRGWFRSSAITKITLNSLDLENSELYQLNIVAKITHGPMIINWTRFYFAQSMISADIKLNDIQNSLLNRPANAKPIATAKIKLKLSGNTKINLNSAPLSYQSEDLSLNWHGLKMNMRVSSLYNRIQSNTEFYGIEIQTKERSVQLGKIMTAYQGEQLSSGLWLGERSIQLDSLVIKSIYDRILAFNDLNFSSQGKINQKNLINSDNLIIIDNIDINGGIYSNNKLEFEINNIDQKALLKLIQQSTPNKLLTSPTSAGLDLLTTIANDGGEINLKQINSTTPWGRTSASIKVTFPDQPNNNILSLITGTTITTKIRAKQELVLHLMEKFYQNFFGSRSKETKEKNDPAKKAQDLLNEWQESGKIFTESDDDYLNINFDYKDSQMLINNKPLILTTKP